MASTTQTFVGVFDEASLADNAISALEQAGFRSDQIYYSGHQASRGGFFAGLKSLFTGEDTTTGRVTDNLTSMGLSQDEARYYENEYQAGHTVVAVQADGREQEAMSIMRANGAHTYGRQRGTVQTDYATNTTAGTNYTTNTATDTGYRADTGIDQPDRITTDDMTDAQRNI